MKGVYVLLMELKTDKQIQIGKLGKLFFKKGFYAYVGSALNNLEKRIQRHLSLEKKMHWHVDYLLKYANITDVFYKETNEKIECNVARKLAESLKGINGFGCSDCNCKSHLFYGSNKEIKNEINLFLLFPINE